jgi:hypothetical protein
LTILFLGIDMSITVFYIVMNIYLLSCVYIYVYIIHIYKYISHIFCGMFAHLIYIFTSI